MLVENCTPVIGATVSGLVSQDLCNPSVVATLCDDVARFGVLFLPGVRLTRDSHRAFAALLGQRTLAHPVVPARETAADLFRLDSRHFGRADHWHTDSSFVEHPPSISVLSCVECPSVGGDTLWADARAAYAGLPGGLRAFVDSCDALHTNRFDYGPQQPNSTGTESGANASRLQAAIFETVHPMVRVHPRTGDRALYLGSYAHRIQGIDSELSRRLLNLLAAEVGRPEYSVRWRWSAGDVAIWDNRICQHRAVNDYGSAVRVVERVTVDAESVVGVDGRRSRPVVGDDSTWRHASNVLEAS